MRNKTPLALIEIAVMVVVFAMASALSLKAFAQADKISKKSEEKNLAVISAQNVAELLKAAEGNELYVAEKLGGICTEDGLKIYCDESMKACSELNAAYVVRADTVHTNMLGKAEITVISLAENCEVFSMCCAWQEEQQ